MSAPEKIRPVPGQEAVAVIGGADHPVGRSLLHRLAARGVRVIAIGTDEDRLIDIGRQAVPMVEVLVMRRGRGALLSNLRDCWENTPLDYYFDLMPLENAKDLHPSEIIARSAGIAAALGNGMRAGRTQAVIAVPVAGVGDPPARGFEGLVRQLNTDMRPGRVMGLSIPQIDRPLGPSDCESAADAVLTLGDAASRGLAGGVILSWNPDDPEAFGSDRTVDKG